MQKKKKEGKKNYEEINQEGDNLTDTEKRGLAKLRKRIKEGNIVIVKTDKSGKIAAMSKEKYLEMGLKNCIEDRKIDRIEVKNRERNINDHTRMLIKALNAGEAHGHVKRIIDSKVTNSETIAPK